MILSSFWRRILATPGGQLPFPATQVPSTDPNTLDDYEEGTWTPVLTFVTPGDLAVTYTTQTGTYTKIGRLVTVHFNVVTASFTHTTAAGNMNITGSPFTNSASGAAHGTLAWSGITKAGFTDIKSRFIVSTATMTFLASGSGVAAAAVTAADMPTGGAVILRGTIVFEVD